jgi:hypothetical protein
MGFNRAAYIQLRQPSAKAAICSLNAGIFFYLQYKAFYWHVASVFAKNKECSFNQTFDYENYRNYIGKRSFII